MHKSRGLTAAAHNHQSEGIVGITIYGDRISGNCLKVKWVADRMGLAHDWIDVDILRGEAKTPAFLKLNPAGQVPVVVLDDGRSLAQSGAIIWHFAEGSDLIPSLPFERAKMLEWMFWEQYSHEPAIAVRRFQKLYLGKADDDIDPNLLVKGHACLARMEAVLSEQAWFVAGDLSLADVALVAYTRFAPEGGFDLDPYPAIRSWISRVEVALAIAP